MERLALVLLNYAEKREVEAGLTHHVTPCLTPASLAALTGLGADSLAVLLDYLLAEGVVAWWRQRLLIWRPDALYQLALGAIRPEPVLRLPPPTRLPCRL